MKAVILAGGLGTRMREETEYRPKPMVEIGGIPVLLHLMKTLGAQGISEFIICVGYKGDVIRDYFLNFHSRFSDFTITTARDGIEFHDPREVPNWKVTVAETGDSTPTGGRVNKIQKYVNNERFLVTYGDGLANINLKELIASHDQSGCDATVTATVPQSRYGVVERGPDGKVVAFSEKPAGSEEVSIGFFIFEPRIFDLLDNDTVLEKVPLEVLAKTKNLNSFRHDGFFQPMDTQREVDELRKIWESGAAPWSVS
jgi:glucose-1-phosphate cytidylyltransferase